jgi:hypothetical protein
MSVHKCLRPNIRRQNAYWPNAYRPKVCWINVCQPNVCRPKDVAQLYIPSSIILGFNVSSRTCPLAYWSVRTKKRVLMRLEPDRLNLTGVHFFRSSTVFARAPDLGLPAPTWWRHAEVVLQRRRGADWLRLKVEVLQRGGGRQATLSSARWRHQLSML